MLRAQEGLQGCLLVDGLDEVVGNVRQVVDEAYLTGRQGTLAEAYLRGVHGILAEAYLQGAQGHEPEKAWWAVRMSAPTWHAVGSYERPTRSWRRPYGKERLERA